MAELHSPTSSSVRPFAAVSVASRYFPATSIEEARQRIGRGVERGEGPALAIGSTGIGKTMLLEVLAQQFDERFCVVLLTGAQLCTRRALLQTILFQVGLPYRSLDEGELRLSFLDFLRPQDAPARRVLLLVDEAESLPMRLLEELRVLTNIAHGGELLVSMVLAGGASLEESLADPKMEVLSQRITTRCYLSALGRDQAIQYVRAQVAAVGFEPDSLFAADGLEAIFAATDGVPRLVNQLCDQLMWMVDQTGYAPVDAEIVQQAWSDLQQLPAPWNTPPVETISSAVEFGELSSLGEAFEEFDGIAESHPTQEHSLDDDLPASIPMNAVSPTRDPHQVAKTFDATEQLLEQLSDTELDEPVVAPAAHNPFAEAFDSEETISDDYGRFESQLLKTAPQVINRTDTAFAQQLKQLEVAPTVVDSDDSQSSPLLIDTTNDDPPSEECSDVLVSDVLIIDDSDRPTTEVVPGDRYRQLFSSLESGTSAM